MHHHGPANEGNRIPMGHGHSGEVGSRDRWLPTLDRFAILLSAACAVHCIATPILLAVAPMLGSHGFENGMRAVLGGLAVLAVGSGSLLHGNWRSIPFLVTGLVILAGLYASDLHGDGELPWSLAASAALITAHVLNSLACRAEGRARRQASVQVRTA